jgi:mevalonate kinase
MNHANGHHNGAGTSNGNGRWSGNGVKDPLLRKNSAPMMPAFMISAPGKVILFGEHAVVYGKVRNHSPSLQRQCS